MDIFTATFSRRQRFNFQAINESNPMRKIFFLIIAIAVSIALTARAQVETNAPKTDIENLELLPDAVIVKGFSNLGSVMTSAGAVTVRAKETSNLANGRKEYGISVVLETTPPYRQVVDYDELDSLINSMDFLNKIAYDVTSMPAFDAAFTTKSGLQISAHSDRRNGGIATFLQFTGTPRIPLTSDEYAQLENLIRQAKNAIDTIKNKNSP